MMKRKPQIVWMVKSPVGWLLHCRAGFSRSEVIAKFVESGCDDWKQCRREGYSVVRVELREVRAAK